MKYGRSLSGITVVFWKNKDLGIGPERVEGLELKGSSVAIGGEEFGEIGLGDSREDMEDIKFKEVRTGERRSVRLAVFPEFGKAGRDGTGMMGRIGVLDPEVFQ